MNKTGTGFFIILVLSFVFPFHVIAGPALENIEMHVRQVIEVLRDPSMKSASAEEAKKEKVILIINDIFDYTELSKRTLGRNWNILKSTQQNEFVDLFSRLLGDVYMDRILAYTNEEVDFIREAALSEEKVEVSSQIITGSKTIPMNYRMMNKAGEWKVYDVVIEGVSLIKNYRSQFKEILSKKSPEGLIKIMREKVGIDTH